MVAKQLETKIRDAILSASRAGASSSTLFAQDATGLSNLQRPRTSTSLPLYTAYSCLTRRSAIDFGPQYRSGFHDLAWMDISSTCVRLLNNETQPCDRAYCKEGV